jgi:hypothetical protein
MTFKVEDKRIFSPDGTPIEPTSRSAESAPPPRAAEEAAGPAAPLPAPVFGDLVVLLGAQAGMCMGGPPPEPGAPPMPKDLEAARHFIDLLGVLAEKTKGNLTPDEDGLLREVLTGLRLQFVRAAEAR